MKHKNLFSFSLAISLCFFFAQACSCSSSTGQNLDLPSTSVTTINPSQIESGSLEFEGQEREYIVFTTGSYSEDQEYPMVIYLHSWGWTAEHDMEVTQLNQVADNNDFIVVYPSAVGLVWNSGIGDRVARETPDVNDVGFIDLLIDTVGTSYNLNLDRIYATGWSNGGFMAYKLACQLSHRIAAVAPVSGVLSTTTLEECNPLRPVPVLHIHGTRDSNVPIDGYKGWNSVDQTLSYWVTFNNCTKTKTTKVKDLDKTDDLTVEKTSYSDCANNSNVVFFKRIGGGHSWPVAVHGIVASEEVWNFFKDYQLTPLSVEN